MAFQFFALLSRAGEEVEHLLRQQQPIAPIDRHKHEPFSNWAASVAEDVAVIGGLWIALHNPILFLVLLGLVVAAMAWALPKILRLIGRVIARIAAWFRGNGA
jgi:hypothetical protein